MWFHRHMEPGVAARVRLSRPMLALIITVFALLAAGLVVLAERSLQSEPAQAAPVATIPTSTTSTTTTTTLPEPEVPVSTPLATPNGVIRAYDAPGGADIGAVGVWYGRPMTMPIVEEQGDWLRIMRPERPNGSTGWVRREDVTLSSSAYRIVVRLAETRLYVYQDGFELFSAPVGIGKDRTPTAPGSFFVAIVSIPGPKGYGPVVLDTSGHSEAIESWEGSGDAVTSIHGPISAGSDAQIGTTGTKISNGCIRMHVADQQKLAVIPVGTPVDIVP